MIFLPSIRLQSALVHFLALWLWVWYYYLLWILISVHRFSSNSLAHLLFHLPSQYCRCISLFAFHRRGLLCWFFRLWRPQSKSNIVMNCFYSLHQGESLFRSFWCLLDLMYDILACLQVSVGRRPVTGLRLYLEGMKCNRLAIHLQHLTTLPRVLQPHWDTHVSIGKSLWKAPEEQDIKWFEPVQWKGFSHVSTKPIEHNPSWVGDSNDAYIVTGAQLQVWFLGYSHAWSLLFYAM